MPAPSRRLAAPPPVGPVYLTADEIAARVQELGADIARDYAASTLLFVAPLHGSTVFLADLSRAVAVPHELEFVQLAAAGRTLRLVNDVERSLAGRDVVIVVTLVDTGLTVNAVARSLASRVPRSIAIAALLDRPHRRLVNELPLRYVGFRVPDELLAGYGLGLDERWRALPDLRVVSSSAS